MSKRSSRRGKGSRREAPIPPAVYPVIDTDLGRDNVENDLPEADRQDLIFLPPPTQL